MIAVAARAVLLAAAFFPALPVGAAPPCTDWNSARDTISMAIFLEVARVADIHRCLDAGARLDARTEAGETLLHLAAANSKSPAVVQTLLNAGAQVDARTEDGFTPLHFVVQALLDAGAAVDAREKTGFTPLHLAAAHSKTPAVVQVLLDAGASLDARTEDGFTPLHFAARNSETPAVVRTLLDAGANPAAKASLFGITPWDLAQKNAALKGTDTYWRLNEGRFE